MQTTATIFSTRRPGRLLRLGAGSILFLLSIATGFYVGRATAPTPEPRVLTVPSGCLAAGEAAGGFYARHIPETMISQRRVR